MKKRAEAGDPGGSLIGQSSLMATRGAPGNQHYSASKGTVISIIRGITVEFGRYGIRANAILPGLIATDMNRASQTNASLTERVISRKPIRRWGVPEDLAGLAV